MHGDPRAHGDRNLQPKPTGNSPPLRTAKLIRSHMKYLKRCVAVVLWIPTVVFWTQFLFSFKLMCFVCVKKLGFTPNGDDKETMIWSFQGVTAYYTVKKD